MKRRGSVTDYDEVSFEKLNKNIGCAAMWKNAIS